MHSAIASGDGFSDSVMKWVARLSATSIKECDGALAGNGAARDKGGDEVSAPTGEAKDWVHVTMRHEGCPRTAGAGRDKNDQER